MEINTGADPRGIVLPPSENVSMFRLLLTVLAILVIAGAALLVGAYLRLSAEITGDIDRLLAAADSTPGPVVTAAMLAGLPEPAQRYLTRAGIVGRPIPRTIRLTQSGRIRSSNEASWMELEAEETYSVSPPAFVWRTWLPSAGLPIALGRDAYLDGEGSILIRLLALFPVADEQGDALREAGLMRFLNEMVWFPAAFLGPNVRFGSDGPDSFAVTLSDRGLSATATLFVDPDGRLVNFRARRYNTSTRSIETWETPMSGYGSFEGLQLPVSGSAVWRLPDGDLTYIEIDITSLRYDGGPQ
ncbi:MAG: hypothetical protein IPK28_16690 [Devosia sp.]|nr:hypothetical protein [Devosia sp.]